MVGLRKGGISVRDFPIFTTQYGIASLVMREIPYRQRAYIKILDSCQPLELMQECCSFCTAVGAERVYGSGDPILSLYPCYAKLLEMQCDRNKLPLTSAVTVAVTADRLNLWKQIYNEKMSQVPNASYMDDISANKMLSDGSGYFVYQKDHLIGIGKISDGTIEALAAVEPGMGQDIVAALSGLLKKDVVRLQVAQENTRAMALYQRLGFTVTEEISCWYQIV